MSEKKPPQKPFNLYLGTCQVKINHQQFTRLEISPYYEKHNREYIDALERKGIKLTPTELAERLITDELIEKVLVPQLNGEEVEPDGDKYYQYTYYHFEPVYRENGKAYRLVWCVSDDEPTVLGIMDCYRRKQYDNN